MLTFNIWNPRKLLCKDKKDLTDVNNLLEKFEDSQVMNPTGSIYTWLFQDQFLTNGELKISVFPEITRR